MHQIHDVMLEKHLKLPFFQKLLIFYKQNKFDTATVSFHYFIIVFCLEMGRAWAWARNSGSGL